MKHNKILIIGAVPYPERPKTLGGVTVLMQNFLNFCSKEKIPCFHVSANRFGKIPGAAIWNILYLLFLFACYLPFCNTVMFNGTVNCAFRVYPLLAPISLLLRKKIILRVFGGNYPVLFSRQPSWLQKEVLWLLNKTNLIFGETSFVLDFFQKKVSPPERVVWFPKVRCPVEPRSSGTYRKKMVFISRIIKSKGVDLILNVMKSLPDGYSVDFYGPFGEAEYSPEKLTSAKTSYKGVLSPETVPATLRNYDLLLLPTFFIGEGYPGIIIEAFSLGLPVIATKFSGIPEMFTDGKEGILIPPKDEAALRNAILSVTEESWQDMSKNAVAIFNARYNSEIINKKICERILAL